MLPRQDMGVGVVLLVVAVVVVVVVISCAIRDGVSQG